MKRVVVTYKDELGNFRVAELRAKHADGELAVFPSIGGGFTVQEKRPDRDVPAFRAQWAPEGYIMVVEDDFVTVPDLPEEHAQAD